MTNEMSLSFSATLENEPFVRTCIASFVVCLNPTIDEIVEIVIDLNSCYFAGSKHYRPMLWPCNVDSNEDGAAFLLGYDKVMEASKLAVHSEDSIKKIRARLSSGKR